MVMPLAGRLVAAVAGALLVLTAWASMIGTVMVPRPVTSWLTRWVDTSVVGAFRLAADSIADEQRRDRVLAAQASTILLGQLVAWLAIFCAGYALLLWPFDHTGITSAFTSSGSSMFTLGFELPSGAGPAVIVFIAAATGLVAVALQIAYLPVLYAAFNRRETEVALLNARAGVPSWGPELLARTHYALGSGVSTIDTLPDLFAQWERWAADVAESHTTYLPLVRFRSPRPLSSWVTALLAVLDSAALILSLSPGAAPVVPARLCLRSGFLCLDQIAQAMGLDVPGRPSPSSQLSPPGRPSPPGQLSPTGKPAPAGEISLTYDDFLDAINRLRKVGFPIEREPAEAWVDFAGWRVNYEQAAYALAYAVDAVPALWSGPRRHPVHPIDPIRPPLGRPPAK